MAVGTGNVIAGLVGAFPVNASPARTAAVADAGGRTQLTGLLSAVVIVALIPLAGVLHDVPLATLAGVLLFVASRLFHFGELTKIARFDRFEFALTVITLLAVALIGVEQGIGVAVALAILDRTRISAQPRLHVLERLSGTTSWAPPGPGTEATPGVLVVLFATPLWYANASHFGDEARAAIVAAKPPPKVVVLDALGMSDIDYTGTQAMAALLDELQASGTTFAIARAGHRVREELRRAGLLERIGETRLFPTVGAAVQVLEPTR
jgi:MFS superfamily sulfate permease-like transporter